jgi:hypothetical protein
MEKPRLKYAIFHSDCGQWHNVSPKVFTCPKTGEKFQVVAPPKIRKGKQRNG